MEITVRHARRLKVNKLREIGHFFTAGYMRDISQIVEIEEGEIEMISRESLRKKIQGVDTQVEYFKVQKLIF